MPATTPLTLLKSQLNLEHDLDDVLLAHKLDAAERWIGRHIGTDFVAGDAVLSEAALQLAAYWYEQREGASEVALRLVPFGVYDLLAPYREAVTGNVAV